MAHTKLSNEFRSEDFEPIQELAGSGILIGIRSRPPHYLTYQAATAMLAAHGTIATGSPFLQPGASVTFEVTIMQVADDQAIAGAATALRHAEEVGDRYVLIGGLLAALNGIKRAVD